MLCVAALAIHYCSIATMRSLSVCFSSTRPWARWCGTARASRRSHVEDPRVAARVCPPHWLGPTRRPRNPRPHPPRLGQRGRQAAGGREWRAGGGGHRAPRRVQRPSTFRTRDVRGAGAEPASRRPRAGNPTRVAAGRPRGAAVAAPRRMSAIDEREPRRRPRPTACLPWRVGERKSSETVQWLWLWSCIWVPPGITKVDCSFVGIDVHQCHEVPPGPCDHWPMWVHFAF